MAKVEKLTPYQESQIIPHRDFWLNFILSCTNRLDKEKAKAGVEWLYQFCGKEIPKVVFVQSPLGCQVAANILNGKIEASLEDNPVEVAKKHKLEYYPTSYYGNVSDYGWVAWIDYFFKMDLIESDKKADFEKFRDMLLSGVFEMIQFDEACIVSDLPTKLSRNAIGQLHDVNGTAVEFSDGYFQHYVNGVYIPENLYGQITRQELSFEDFVKIDNEEVKSAIMSFFEEKHGSEYLFRFISDNLQEIETFTDKKDEKYLEGTTGGMNIGVYTLFKGTVNNIDMAFVRCYCPSTDRMFFLSVDPVNTNPKDAIASLYRIPRKVEGHIKYIQRQGERFSTVLTVEGMKIMKALTQEEVQDLVPISGERYFSLMRYEY